MIPLDFSTLDHIEYPSILSLQNADGTFLDSFFLLVSYIPFLVVIFGITLTLLILLKHKIWKPLLFSFLISMSLNFIINEGIFKHILRYFSLYRPRPWTIHPDILAIGFPFQDSSFPSTHMAMTTLFVIIVSYFEKKFLSFGIILILLMGLSRIHNGMHYPTDVLVGTLMGGLYGYIGLWVMRKYGIEKKQWWKKVFHGEK